MKRNLLTVAFLLSAFCFNSFAEEVTGTLTDYDGNVYQTIVYGDLEWMVENLRVTHFNDGTPISTRDDITTAAPGSNEDFAVYYKFPGNDPDNKEDYGLLYTFFVAFDTEGNPPTNLSLSKLCPEGWYVPSREEWAELAGGSFTGDSWQSGILTGATSLPASFNVQFAGSFNTGGYQGIDERARFWSTELMMPGAGYGAKYLEILASAPATVIQANYRTNNAQSLRLVRKVATTATSVSNNIFSKVKIYQSSASVFTVEGISSTETLTLYDLSGKTLLVQSVSDGSAISMDGLAAGLYIAKIGTETFKIVKK